MNGMDNRETVQSGSPSTAVLLVRIREENDSDAFEVLCVRYDNLLNSMVRRFAPSLGIREGGVSEVLEIGVEELRQDAAMALYRAAQTYVPEEDGKGGDVSFGLYAKICIRNAMISQVRRYRRRMKQAEKRGDGRERENILRPVETEALAEEALRQIGEKLSPYERRILPLYMEGKPPRQIAKTLGRTEKSVSNGIYRIKAKLRELLDRS